MKNYKKGFAGIIVVVIVALGILGFGTYKFFNKSEIKEESLNISAGDNFPEDYKPADHSLSNTDADEKKNNVMLVKSVREYDSEETNIIHSNTNRKVTILGTNFISCDRPMNCEELVYIGTKSFNVMIPALSEFLSFIPEGLADGIYDLYVYNTATGQKSNSIKIKNVNLIDVTNKIIPEWQTYKNEKYGFEIKYPQEWAVYGQFGFGKKGQGSGYDGELFVHVLNQSLAEAIKDLELKEENRAGDSMIKKTNITINGIPATYIVVTNEYLNKSDPSWEWHNILFEKNGVTYSISNGAIKSELFEEFYQSFKFIN